MINKIHPVTAIIATLCIATFFTSTVLVELFGSYKSIAMVKSLIVVPGLFILIPAIAAAGATGFALAKKRARNNFANSLVFMSVFFVTAIVA